jgi:hypothetical protein
MRAVCSSKRLVPTSESTDHTMNLHICDNCTPTVHLVYFPMCILENFTPDTDLGIYVLQIKISVAQPNTIYRQYMES